MQTSSLIALLIGAALGLGVGALVWHGRLAALERSERRATAAEEQLEATEAERRTLGRQVLELQRALRAERSLLDGVAAQSGIAARDFRRALARDVLHPADPSRETYESEPPEATDQLGAVENQMAALRSELELARSELAGCAAELAGCTAELAGCTADLAATRGDAETLAELVAASRRASAAEGTAADRRDRPGASHWSDVPRRLTSLQDEVASLRSQIADRAVAGDRSAVRQAELGRLLDHVVNELDRLRHQVQESRNQP